MNAPARRSAVRVATTRSRVVFRVAAGPWLGFGHLMRARALARCLEVDAVIALRGGRTARAAAEAIAPVVPDDSALDGAHLLVVDDPNLAEGRRWIGRARRAGVRTVSVHDTGAAHDADLVVCGALGVRTMRTASPALCGPQYYLLDGRIAAARRRPADRRTSLHPRIIVALGGGQHVAGVAQRLVDAIAARRADADIVVAAGFSQCRPRPALRGATWLSASTGLTDALLDADIAVVAGGVTLYEACALGVPAVAMAVVPAQRRAIAAFAREKAVVNAGGSPRAIEKAADGVGRLLADRALRHGIVARARRLVDGRGVFRVAECIHALLEEGDRCA